MTGPLEWRRLEDERLPQPVCTLCGEVAWQNPKPTASGLITRRRADGVVEVLLVRRAKEPYRDQWDCPGGFVDSDEHPEHTVRREMREELGLDVEIVRFVGIFMDEYGDGGESTLNVYYEAVIRGGEISPASDVSEAAWVPLDRLPEPIAFQNSREALRVLKEGSSPPTNGTCGD